MARMTSLPYDDQPATTPPVPETYRGLWRRTLLTTGDGRIDRETRVFWMQTERLHIDIRVPAARGTFGAASALAALTREQLIELAAQMGFAGATTVDEAAVVVDPADGRLDRCTWHRQIDFSPPSNARDLGTMRFETPHVVLEDGIEAVYHERWERDPASLGLTWAVRLSREAAHAAGLLADDLDGAAGDDAPSVFIARCGDFFMFARSRSPRAQAVLASYRGKRLAEVVRDPALDIDDVRALLDFEISLGRVRGNDGARWTIELSTLPWREGQPAFADAVSAALDRFQAAPGQGADPT
ncbi:hypothetical protein B0G69_5632 [Paraburkholderia sp. RAU2J]|uniref:hypothetical protein n=1 Tax=Paraburkholderia sp. RAU2J TaxID=1938810 RepID=UPI000EAF1071|nr:hypothetical protein [Paraburkholderia sp. RAU2J]RKT22196.1 hypothetical protein B0G69_5632 [Paraburkholderia sp. RAU2J]